MAKGISPLAYRLGFFRNWDSLFSESSYVRNYNNFIKSQLINAYIDGFFKKWGWNGRRSYFLNFLYSHSEISWSFNYVNLTVYLYNTGSELVYHRFLKEAQDSYKFPYRKNAKKKVDLIKYLNVAYVVSTSSKYKYASSLNRKSRLDLLIKLKKNDKSLLNYYKNHNGFIFNKTRSLRLVRYLKNNNLKYSLRKFLYKMNKKSKNFSKKKRNIFNYYGLAVRKKDLSSKALSFVIFFFYLRKLLKLRLYRTFFNLINFYYFVNPLSYAFKRHFLKDFYGLLGLYNISNLSKYFQIKFVKLNPNSITASAFTKHVWLKLHKKYNFVKVVQMAMRSSKTNSLFAGMRISMDGRATKKQKAWHKTFINGKIHLSTQSALLDSASVQVKLRYGVLSVKMSIGYV